MKYLLLLMLIGCEYSGDADCVQEYTPESFCAFTDKEMTCGYETIEECLKVASEIDNESLWGCRRKVKVSATCESDDSIMGVN